MEKGSVRVVVIYVSRSAGLGVRIDISKPEVTIYIGTHRLCQTARFIIGMAGLPPERPLGVIQMFGAQLTRPVILADDADHRRSVRRVFGPFRECSIHPVLSDGREYPFVLNPRVRLSGRVHKQYPFRLDGLNRSNQRPTCADFLRPHSRNDIGPDVRGKEDRERETEIEEKRSRRQRTRPGFRGTGTPRASGFHCDWASSVFQVHRSEAAYPFFAFLDTSPVSAE